MMQQRAHAELAAPARRSAYREAESDPSVSVQRTWVDGIVMLFAYELDQLGPGSPCRLAARRTLGAPGEPNHLRTTSACFFPAVKLRRPDAGTSSGEKKQGGQQASRSATGVTGLVPHLAALDLGWHTRPASCPPGKRRCGS